MIQVTDWTFKWGHIPSRKSAYFTIEKDGMDIDARHTGWLNDNLEKTTKAKATHISGKRFSYNNGSKESHPETFAIRIK